VTDHMTLCNYKVISESWRVSLSHLFTTSAAARCAS